MSCFWVLARHSAIPLAMIAGLLGGAEAGTARSRQQPEVLAVRFKGELPNNVKGSPFALLAAFPKVVERRASRVTIRERAAAAALVETKGNPLPARKQLVSSGFGMRRHPLLGGWRPHHGVDLAAPAGTPVRATADGIVGAAGWRGGYGLSVTLEHGRDRETRYGHMSRLAVANGQRVQRGGLIGWVGSTGLSTGPHLHYETRVNGRAVDPLRSMRRK
jgi:murein DD-endopeptidase MepM/ murein hydrolase activator NlpD